MDKTHLFKAAVIAAKVQRKSTADGKEQQQQQKQGRNNKNLTIKRDEFSRQMREICHKITTLRNFLLENRSSYMRIAQHLKSSAQMTNEQRDLIDRETEKFFLYYTQYLAQKRADWKTVKRKPQQQTHMDSVFELLNNYLRSVQEMHLQQKKYRAQYELESYRMLKLAADLNQIPVCPGVNTLPRRMSSSSCSSDEESTDFEEDDEDIVDDKTSLLVKSRDFDNESKAESPKLRRRFKHKKSENAKVGNNNDDNDDDDDEDNLKTHVRQVAVDEDLKKSKQERAHNSLNAEDVQLYEQENDELYQELQGVTHEIEAIEKNVVEIAELQNIFTEKVTLQQSNIERISNAVVGATENVKDANEQIRRAIQRNAGLRVWSLFFLLVMSFALLFLDWYYD